MFVLNDMRAEPGGCTITGWLRPGGNEAREPIELEAQPFFRRLLIGRGLRSFMRATVHLRGGLLGGLVFCTTSSDAYSPTDAARARQIADCVALALAHQRLAEEEQRSAEARDDAARLEVRVRRLTEELEEQGRHRVLGHSRVFPWLLG